MGQVCTVREVKPTVVAVVSNVAMMQDVGMPECIEEVLQEWGCTWMWRLSRMQGNEGWLKKSICDGTLVAVTDNLYILERFPDLCPAAFILEGSSGQGRITVLLQKSRHSVCHDFRNLIQQQQQRRLRPVFQVQLEWVTGHVA